MPSVLVVMVLDQDPLQDLLHQHHLGPLHQHQKQLHLNNQERRQEQSSSLRSRQIMARMSSFVEEYLQMPPSPSMYEGCLTNGHSTMTGPMVTPSWTGMEQSQGRDSTMVKMLWEHLQVRAMNVIIDCMIIVKDGPLTTRETSSIIVTTSGEITTGS